MSDFEPVFRDAIGYCNLGCPFTGTEYTQDTDLANDNKPFRVCRHTETQKHSVSSRDDRTVCIPWVRSLLKAETTQILYIQRGPDLDDNMHWWVWEDHIRNKNPVMSSFARSAETRLEALNKALRWSKGKYPIKELPEDNPAKQLTPDEKVREAIGNIEGQQPEQVNPDIRTLIDAYRAERRKSDNASAAAKLRDLADSPRFSPSDKTLLWVAADRLETTECRESDFEAYHRARNPKGTPMSTDNVIYVQRRNAESASVNVPPVYYWYAWAGSTSNESPIPHSPRQRSTRESALAAAHDLAADIGIPNVQELPPEPPTKTQGQQDAEWLRGVALKLFAGFRNLDDAAAEEHLKEIADRLEST